MEYPSACNDSMVNPPCNRSPAMWFSCFQAFSQAGLWKEVPPLSTEGCNDGCPGTQDLDRHLCYWKSSKLRVSFAPIFLDEKKTSLAERMRKKKWINYVIPATWYKGTPTDGNLKPFQFLKSSGFLRALKGFGHTKPLVFCLVAEMELKRTMFEPRGLSVLILGKNMQTLSIL